MDPHIENRHEQILGCILSFADASRPNSSKLKRFLRRFERDDTELEDIVQDALFEAFKCCERYEGRSSPQTWLFGLAANVARNHVAKRVRSVSLVTTPFGADAEDGESDFDWLERPDNDVPDSTYEMSEFGNRLEGAIDTLPGDIRATFDLACLQELPYSDVASALRIPVGTVRSRVNRARYLLKTAMD